MKKTKKVWITTYLIQDATNEVGYYLYHEVLRQERKDYSKYMPEHWVFLHVQPVEIEEPDFDIREKMLESLQGEKKRMMAEYSANMASIEDRISKLTALEVLP
ncbi:MAG: hypothetical protein C0610_16680 [Desulfobacteraceae bacterium]|nr:MAG: hypothetical protein C0610_16680 [Desulfobacteraceae bacterium]